MVVRTKAFDLSHQLFSGVTDQATCCWRAFFRILSINKNDWLFHSLLGVEYLNNAAAACLKDGFGLVEELKLDPRTKTIPVVVVSAKDITPEERKRLNGHIEAVYQKGSLPPRRFVDEVVQVIEEKSIE